MKDKLGYIATARTGIGPRSRGFTLVELIIASAVLLVVMLTVYLSFNTGIFGSRNIDEVINIYQSGRQILSRMDLDLRNSFAYSREKNWFSGNAHDISFLALIDRFENDNFERTLAFISYKLDGDKLFRLCRQGQESINEKSKVQPEEMAEGVQELIFSYGHMNSATGLLEWKNLWDDPEVLPDVIKIKLTIKKKTKQSFERNIFLPLAQ